jgi:hypothetical protein
MSRQQTAAASRPRACEAPDPDDLLRVVRIHDLDAHRRSVVSTGVGEPVVREIQLDRGRWESSALLVLVAEPHGTKGVRALPRHVSHQLRREPRGLAVAVGSGCRVVVIDLHL